MTQSDVLGSIVDGVVGFGENVSDTIGSAFDFIGNVTSEVWSGIESTVDLALNGVKAQATNVANNMKSTLSSAWNNIKTTFSNSLNNIKSGVTSAWNNVKSTTSSIWNNVKNFLSNTWNGISKTATSAFNGLKNGITNIWQGISNIASGIWGGIKNTIGSFASSAASAAMGAFQSLANGISSIFSKIGSWAQSLWNGIKRTFSQKVTVNYSTRGTSSYSSNVPGYASGGIVRSEIWSMNEYGNPEMVGKIGNGSNKTAVANNAIISDAIENAVVRGLTQVLMSRNTSSNNPSYINNTINLDSEVIARAITKAQHNIDRRQHPALLY